MVAVEDPDIIKSKETAFKYMAMAGYDGIEISAIEGMSEHLVLSRWREIAPTVKALAQTYGLELLAMEQPSQWSSAIPSSMNRWSCSR